MNLLADLTGQDLYSCPQSDEDVWPIPGLDNLIEAIVRDMLNEGPQCGQRIDPRIDVALS